MATYEQVLELAQMLTAVLRKERNISDWFLPALYLTRTLPEHRGKDTLQAFLDEINSSMEVQGFDRYTFTSAFRLPLRNLPLMIAVKDPYIRVVARWRLKWGLEHVEI
jgi:hypothetical protein